MKWMKISLILCIFGFLKEFRPSEPFVTDYLTGPCKNFTAAQVNQDIYPVGTYSYLATLVIIFLITDFARYKPVIILCGLSGSVTYLMIILVQTILEMQFLEFFYGIFLSTEVAYYTYIYAKVDKEHYQEVTGHTRSAFLLGRFLAGTTGQLTTSFNLLDYHQLNYITLGALTFATLWAFFLPSVGQSIYFHQAKLNDVQAPSCLTFSDAQSMQDNTQSFISSQNIPIDVLCRSPSLGLKIKHAYILLWKHMIEAYTNLTVIKWSLWWAFATCGYLQVISYTQLIWQDTVADGDNIYNGAVEALYTIIGAATVFGVGKLQLNWPLVGEAMLSIFSFIEGILLLLIACTYNIWLSYTVYILFGVIYHTIVTVASFQVVKHLLEDSYGLIFGINTLIALLLQSLLTYIVISGSIFELNIRSQYFVYSGYFIVLGIVFMIMSIYTIVKKCQSGQDLQLWVRNENLLSNAKSEINTKTAQSAVVC
ncbi:thiamine transporter 1 [Cephus cinctus]|uniref:Thiamine transporter 1 n=1 Tax=Cephus cinctus TaxID=211228 RepID=A0AAJ7BKV2_CEPCN|nr:thiamine transporter 1 [Cephus cinctus]